MVDMHKAAEEVYRNRNNFILIGLTGRSGSGCSTVANILSKDFKEIDPPYVCLSESSDDHSRKKHIIYNFTANNWRHFYKIKVSDIITSFILQERYEDFSKYSKDKLGVDISSLEADFRSYRAKNDCMRYLSNTNLPNDSNKKVIYNYILAERGISSFSKKLKDLLRNKNKEDYAPVYQTIGNNIRKYGKAIQTGEAMASNIYTIAERINRLIKVLRKHNEGLKEKSYFVIDAFRNPFEAVFFQERYSAFYLMAVRCPEEDRYDRLLHSYSLTKGQISKIDERENPKENYLKNIDNFLSQDIATCIQIADIHIDNSGKHTNKDYNDLKEQLVRYISLIQHPGLINPSRDEKMMQIAFTAKLNSGCLSRKVGAVVTNKQGAPKSIGWNSPPEGQTSCLLRSAQAMLSNTDPHAYSIYEKTNDDIRSIASQYISTFKGELQKNGINCSYCFKDFQNLKENKGNQVHNRALHAEENAFLQIAKYGGEGVLGGKLYTTAAPCDACSRKAYQLGIRQIFYIDPYPGIAVDHVLMCGSDPPELILFRGAIGSAYHKMYSSILPYKDELYSYLKSDYFKPPAK